WHVSAQSKAAAPQPHYYKHRFAASLSGDTPRKHIVSTVSQMTTMPSEVETVVQMLDQIRVDS
ncbi:MAG TPA: hypothetical protein VFR76_04705, partial [Verrucomicrobiae bacterium]|nr:hypothetical protein [Verrucomicrobiae bacterium]